MFVPRDSISKYNGTHSVLEVINLHYDHVIFTAIIMSHGDNGGHGIDLLPSPVSAEAFHVSFYERNVTALLSSSKGAVSVKRSCVV
jgi:hypothetical protein